MAVNAPGSPPDLISVPEARGAFAAGNQSGQQLATQYMGRLVSNLNWQPDTRLDENTVQMIGAFMGGLSGHALELGAAPSTDSPVFNQMTDGGAQQIAQQPMAVQVARGVYQNTIGAFLKQWQANPMLAAGELVGTAALFAGAGALDVATGGLATPILWTGFAMLAAPTILPGLVSSIQNELHQPSDSNLAQLLINVGTAGITFGSPVKAFKGISSVRQMAAAQNRQFTLSATPGQGVNALLRNKLGEEQHFLLPEDRFAIVPQTVQELEQEIARRSGAEGAEQWQMPIDEHDALVEKYRNALQEHDNLAAQVSSVQLNPNDFATRDEYWQAVSDALGEGSKATLQESEKALVPLMKEMGHRYGYVLAKENPLTRMTTEELGQIPSQVRGRVDKEARSLHNILYYAGEGWGWDSAPDGVIDTQFAENLAEAMARQGAAGTLHHAERLLQTQFLNMAKHLDVKPERMDNVYAAIEGVKDPEQDQALWHSLSPHEKYLATHLHTAFGIMTNYAYKHSHITLPIQRYVPRMVTHDIPDVGRGTRLTHQFTESLTRGARPVKSRSWSLGVGSDWENVRELQDAEFDPEEGMGTIAERLKQTHQPWLEFLGNEQKLRQSYEQNLPLMTEYKSGKQRTINGEQITLDQFMVKARREHGNAIRNRNLNQKRVKEAPQDLDNLSRQISGDQQRLASLEKQREQLKGARGVAATRQQLDGEMKALRNNIRKGTTRHANISKNLETWKSKVDRYQAEVEGLPARKAKEAGVDKIAGAEKWFDVNAMPRPDFKKNVNAKPGGRKLLSGYDLPRVSFARYLRQMNMSRYREGWEGLTSMTNVSGEAMKLAYGARSGLSLAEIGLLDRGEQPIALHANVRAGERGRGIASPGDLADHGYEMVMPSQGEEGALNFKPAIYAKKEIVGRYREAAQKAEDATDMQTAFARSLYDISVGIPKRLIMGSPAWHGKNVLGRAVVTYFQHPNLTTHALFNVLKDRFVDPGKYYQTKLDHWADGGVPANRFNVRETLNHLEQELSGQRNFLTMMRAPGEALSHAHAVAAEGWFWKTVDDVGTAAYLVKKWDLMTGKDIQGRARPWMSESMAGMLSAEYANNVVGMVNPLYMSKLWRWGRQMIFFAPTWWTTFARMVGQSIPGSTRFSNYARNSKRLASLDPVKMHSLDLRQRKELVRMHRSYFITMMGAALMTHDLLNFTFSGHHVWENQKGHEWDLEMDRLYAPQLDPSGNEKRVHLHSMQFFNQSADILNAAGLGHDWGFAHVMQGDNFKKANGIHKAMMLGSAVGQGVRQQSAGKLSTAVNMGVGAGLGIDPYSLLRDGQLQDMPRPEALVGALPGGNYAQRTIDQTRRAALRAQIEGTPQPEIQKAMAEVGKTEGKAALTQFLGLPSMFYSGDEPSTGYHFLSEAEQGKYLQSRQKIMNSKKAHSEQLLTGQMTPADWVVQNELTTQSYLQLLADTFGEGSTGKTLFDTRRQLYQKYNLDDPKLSRQQKTYALQQFESDWQKQMDAASPEAKAHWWEAHTSMWTDADYLYYLTQQMRDSVQAHIDGQGGQEIKAAESRLGAQGLPLDPKTLDALRQSDPKLWTYHAVMSQIGKSSLVGALAAAYWDPFANFAIFPDDQAPTIQAMDEQGLLKGGATLARSGAVRGLAAAGRGISQEAAPEGGQIAGTPLGQQAATGLSAGAAQNILEQDDQLSPTSTKRLSPEERAWLEQLIQGGRSGG